MAKFFTSVIRHMNYICIRGYDGDRRVKKKIKFKPTLYVRGKGESQYKTLDGQFVEPIQQESMSEAKKFIEQYSEIENFTIYGTTNYIHQFIASEYPGSIQWDRDKIRIHTFDIETNPEEGQSGFPHPDKAEHPITAITIHDSITEVYSVWTTAKWNREDSKFKDTDTKIDYFYCSSEKELLNGFIRFWHDEFTCPDVITGWNIRTFDVPYIVNRVSRVLGDEAVKRLSPWGLVEEKSLTIHKKQVQTYELSGISQLDYLDLFQKFAYSYGPQESYKLDHIANVVLGERKLSYEEYGNLRNLYKENSTQFVSYNIVDVELIVRMEDMTGLLSICFSMGYRAGANFQEAFGTTSIWDALIHRYLLEQNIVVPPNRSAIKLDYEGAFVKEVQVGMHDWVCSFDLARLYPSIIVLLNISPETVLVGDVEPGVNVDRLLDGYKTERTDACMAATGQYFSNNGQGFLPRIIESLNAERDIAKTKMKQAKQAFEFCDKSNEEEVYRLKKAIAHYSNEEQTVKIFSNSLYGSLGNKFFRYFMMEIAEGITITGQYVIKSVNKAINEYLNRILETKDIDFVIAGDTDSSIITLSHLVKKMNFGVDVPISKKVDFLDVVCKKIQSDVLVPTFDTVLHNLNGFKQSLSMKREAIAERGIFVAKKRNIIKILDHEGVRYSEPKLKITGIEAIKSSTPAPCREAMKKLFHVIMNGSEDDTRRFIQVFREEYDQLPIEDKAFPRGVSSINKYLDRKTIYAKGTPINSRCAILYNHLLREKGLLDKYELIGEGDKMKYVYLNPRNPLRTDAIGFSSVLPVEFDMHRYLDNEVQFQKTFIDPVKMILEAVGWKIEEESSLEDFFS